MELSETDSVEVRQDGPVYVIKLNRPATLNSLDGEAIAALHEAAIQAGSSSAVRAVLITGNGRAFCAGGDLKAMLAGAAGKPDMAAVMAKRIAGELHLAIAELRRMPKPVICAVNGPCAGAGVGLALAGDIVWAAESATFTLAYSSVGLAPDGSTTYFLPRAVGEQMALDLFLSSREVKSDEALKIGLVSRVLPDEELLEKAEAFAARLGAGPTRCFAETKALVLRSLHEGLETQMESERQAIARAITTEDFREGVAAFMGKRKPEFKGC